MAFLLETFRGFIALIGIPFAIALFLEIRRIGGLSALEQRLHPKKSPPEYNKDEEDIFQESNFERNVKPRSTRPHRNIWFSQAGKSICGFDEIQRFKIDSMKRSMPPYLAVLLLEYVVFLPFLGHLGCILSNWLQTNVGFGIANIGADYLSLHLTLATLYAAIELVLHSIGLVIRNKEQTVFDILCNMRDYLCEELGKERGSEAAHFIALIMDVYMDSQDRDEFIKQSKNIRLECNPPGRAFVRYILSMFDAKQKTLQAVSMTQEGEALLREIRVCV